MSRSIVNWLRRAAVCVAVVATLPVISSPALAAHVTVDDTRHDMWRVEEGGTQPAPRPKAAIGDFVRASFKHSDARVRVTAKFVELARTGRRFALWVDVRNEDGKKTIAGVITTRRDRGGRALLMTNRGRDIDCRVRHSIDYKQDTVRVSFPRRCIDNPRYLQFRAMSEHVRRNWAYAYLDNPHNNKAVSRSWTEKVRHG